MIHRVCALLLGALVLATSLPAGAQEAPVEVDAILSLTGPAAFLGSKEAEAFHAVESVTNKSGGIRGRPLHIVIADDQSNPQTALQLLNGLTAKGVAVVLGPSISPPCNALFPIVNTAGPLLYCLSPIPHPPQASYMFTATASSAYLVEALMNYARSRGWKRLGLITSNDATGQDLAKQIDTLLAEPVNAGLAVVARESFNLTDLSVAAQMARIKAAQPQVLITTSTGTPFATLLHGIADAGLAVPVVSNGSNMTFTAMAQYANLLPAQLYFTGDRGVVLEDRAVAAVRAAQTTFQDAIKALGARADFGHVLAWDAGMLVVDSLRQLGPTAGATQLRDRLVFLRGWTGISGVYDFPREPQRGVGLEATMIYRWDASKSAFLAVSLPGGALH